jgi:hypothetical protein
MISFIDKFNIFKDKYNILERFTTNSKVEAEQLYSDTPEVYTAVRKKN